MYIELSADINIVTKFYNGLMTYSAHIIQFERHSYSFQALQYSRLSWFNFGIFHAFLSCEKLCP